MQISGILRQEAVKSLSSVTSKKRLFHEISDLANSVYGLDVTKTCDALQERETLGPTGVGRGVALPHARLDDLEEVVALFIRLDQPLDFESADRQPADLFFVLLAPLNAGADHLKALALVSRTMRDADTCAKLRSNSDPSTLHAILTELIASKAA